MNDEPRPDEANEPEPPVFDKAAARQRYRATMRSPQMRLLYALLALVILASWGFGFAAVFAKDVEQLPGHDLGVLPRQCITCHTQRLGAAPPMPHVAFPTCGFCHRQSMPTPTR
jgi:hypothetical protein